MNTLHPGVRRKLEELSARRAELLAGSGDPELLSDAGRMAELQRELGRIGATADRYEAFLGLERDLHEHEELAEGGDDLAALAREELPALREKARSEIEALLDLMLSADGDGARSAIVEIRAGTGGDEAGLWARDLREMYVRYAEKMGWRVEAIDASPNELGGFREVVFSIQGDGVFHHLGFESGGHRVQRVPATETQGRIHTSLATVAVLPEAEDVEVEIADKDLEMQAVRASGPGGQNVNKVSSAVRLTHLPTGLSVFCQEERSQVKNRQKAMKLLKSRLLDAERRRVDSERAADRKAQIGSGDRSARVRTYNFPQNRLTDHRLGQNFALLPVVEGKLDPVVMALLASDRERRIAEL